MAAQPATRRRHPVLILLDRCQLAGRSGGKRPGRRTAGEARRPSARRPKILVVDDECVLTDTTVLLLRQQGYRAKGVYSAEAALAEARAWQPQLVVLDVVLPGASGITAAEAMARELPDVRVVLISGQPVGQLLQNEGRELPFEVLAKPVTPQELLAKIRQLGSQPIGR